MTSPDGNSVSVDVSVDVPTPDARHTLDAFAAQAAGQAGAENFPVALKILPARPRDLLGRLYAYARFVDDIGDEAPGDRLAMLDLIATDVRRLAPSDDSRGDHGAGTPILDVVRQMSPLVDQAGVPVALLLDLIEANRIDQTVASYDTYADLMAYCHYSAAPIGRSVLHVAGQAGSHRNLADSDAVCGALQVLEHCQDVGEDAAAGRVYLPAVDLKAADVAPEQLMAPTTSVALRAVIAAQVDFAQLQLRAGPQLVRRLHGWARVAVAGYVAGGLATVDALRAADFDVLGQPVTPSRARTARHALALMMGRTR